METSNGLASACQLKTMFFLVKVWTPEDCFLKQAFYLPVKIVYNLVYIKICLLRKSLQLGQGLRTISHEFSQLLSHLSVAD